MISSWTAHLKDEKQKKNFSDRVLRAKDVLERLSEILTEEENSLDRVELTPKAFEQPNWAERQAFFNGSRASLHKVLKIINLDQKEEKQ